MAYKQNDSKNSVPATEYDSEWITETWGWDTPEEFIKNQGRNLRPRIKMALEISSLKAGMHILDVGCGRGEVVLYCGRKGINAIGIDYSPQAIDLAMKAKASHALEHQERMQFVCGYVNKLQTEKKFDRIFMLDLVEHLHDEELLDLFRICKSMLAPNGALIIHTLPNRWLYEITYRRVLRLIMPWLPADPRSDKEKAIHINEMSITHLAHLLKKTGFENRVWLQDAMVDQARWHQKEPLSGKRGRLYKLLAGPIPGTIFKLFATTPLRLLIVNDIFSVAWKSSSPAPINLPAKWTERLIIRCTS